MKIKAWLVLLILAMGLSFQLQAKEDSKEKGLKIARDSEKANENFIGEELSMKMILIDAHGTRTEREMIGKVKEILSDGDKSISEFLNPKDVKGTKLLTWAHKKEDDQQWLYLPSLRRVKRISGSSKTASFMGSEFSYEDLGGQSIEKYDHNWLKDIKHEGESVSLVERKPKEKSGYTRQVIAFSPKYQAPVMIEYYDRKNELLKVATFKGYKQYTVKNKKMWRSGEIHMKNLQTLKQSTIIYSERKLGLDFNDSEFDQGNLK